MKTVSLTEQVHTELEDMITTGDVVIDATAGNGHDTLFLARRVGDSGHVYAFDTQQSAIESTRNRLVSAGLSSRVELIHAGHESMTQHIRPAYRDNITAVVFNLGYLPGRDKSIQTKTDTSLAALQQAYALLKPSGVLSVIAYPGHRGGDLETEAVKNWFDGLENCSYRLTVPESRCNNAPCWFRLVKSAGI